MLYTILILGVSTFFTVRKQILHCLQTSFRLMWLLLLWRIPLWIDREGKSSSITLTNTFYFSRSIWIQLLSYLCFLKNCAYKYPHLLYLYIFFRCYYEIHDLIIEWSVNMDQQAAIVCYDGVYYKYIFIFFHISSWRNWQHCQWLQRVHWNIFDTSDTEGQLNLRISLDSLEQS